MHEVVPNGAEKVLKERRRLIRHHFRRSPLPLLPTFCVYLFFNFHRLCKNADKVRANVIRALTGEPYEEGDSDEESMMMPPSLAGQYGRMSSEDNLEKKESHEIVQMARYNVERMKRALRKDKTINDSIVDKVLSEGKGKGGGGQGQIHMPISWYGIVDESWTCVQTLMKYFEDTSTIR